MSARQVLNDLSVAEIGDQTNLKCNFTFDPDKWRESRMVNQQISCPYNSIPGLNYCIFHILPHQRMKLFKSREEINRQYIQAIANERNVQIFCTTIDAASLSRVIKTIPPEVDIDISFTKIREHLDISGIDISNKIKINDCHLNSLSLNQTTLEKGIRIADCVIDNFELDSASVDRVSTFSGIEFGTASIKSTTFQRAVRFHSAGPDDIDISEIDEYIGQDACVFRETAEFMESKFESGAMFNGVVFKQAALFSNTIFRRGGSFYDLDVSLGVDFHNSYFGNHTSFQRSDLGIAAFLDCEFAQSARFENVEFGNEYTEYIVNYQTNGDFCVDKVHELAVQHHDLVENTFVKHYTNQMRDAAGLFNRANVNGRAFFKNVTLKGRFRSDYAYYNHIEIEFDSTLSTAVAQFHRATINRGIIHINDANCYIELENATLGSTDIQTDGDKNPFKNIYFNSTNIEGFEFSDYRKELNDINWEIAEVDTETRVIGPDEKEVTYTKAKAGADKLGDRLAESKFSILEERYRRKRYRIRLQDSENIIDGGWAGYNLTTNWLYDKISTYGENPIKVLAWSALTTIGFSLIYNPLVDWGSEMDFSLTVPYLGRVGYNVESWVLSVQSFTSFLIGQQNKGMETNIRLIASLESFIGAFLIAFFVAIIVRRIRT